MRTCARPGTSLKMALVARLNVGETIGNRVMKVYHAGEHRAVCIYLAQTWIAWWREP